MIEPDKYGGYPKECVCGWCVQGRARKARQEEAENDISIETPDLTSDPVEDEWDIERFYKRWTNKTPRTGYITRTDIEKLIEYLRPHFLFDPEVEARTIRSVMKYTDAIIAYKMNLSR